MSPGMRAAGQAECIQVVWTCFWRACASTHVQVINYGELNGTAVKRCVRHGQRLICDSSCFAGDELCEIAVLSMILNF